MIIVNSIISANERGIDYSAWTLVLQVVFLRINSFVCAQILISGKKKICAFALSTSLERLWKKRTVLVFKKLPQNFQPIFLHKQHMLISLVPVLSLHG